MKFVVKSTTISRLADLLCPHICRGCGRLGAVLCECCKNDLFSSRLRVCPLCQQVLAEKKNNDVTWKNWHCENCDLSLDAIFVGGWREGVLAQLIKEYKYHAVRAAGDVLVEVLDRAIPDLAENTVIAPLPTVGKHVRARGLDHTLVLAKKLARKRGWKCQQLLLRAADTVQVGTKAAERQQQAKRAYMTRKKADNEVNYLLLDDVWTTGASMLAAEEVLRAAGAKQVMGVVLAIGKEKQKSTS